MPRGRKPNILVNDIQEEMVSLWYGRDERQQWPVWLDDILYGIARLDWYGDRENQVPLSTTKIMSCFLNLDEISTDAVAELLGFKKSQAKLYAQACRLAYPYLKRSLNDPKILAMIYPNNTIVSEEQGIALKYHIQHRSMI